MSDIGNAYRKLQKERREYMTKVMQEYDEEYYVKVHALQDVCEHNFKFTDFGPIGHAWYHCTICDKSKVEDPD